MMSAEFLSADIYPQMSTDIYPQITLRKFMAGKESLRSVLSADYADVRR